MASVEAETVAEDEVAAQLEKCEQQITEVKAKLEVLRKESSDKALREYTEQQRAKEKETQIISPISLTEACTLRGHMDKVYSVAWSGHCDRLASVSWDGRIMIWNPETQDRLMPIPLRSSHVCALDLNRDATISASGGLDNLVTLNECIPEDQKLEEDGSPGFRGPLAELQIHQGYVSEVSFMGDGDRVLSSSGDCSVIMWDVHKQVVMETLVGHKQDVECVHHSEQNGLIVTGSIDCTSMIWDIRSPLKNERLFQFSGHDGDINDVQWMQDGRCFLSGSDDQSVRLWDIRCLKQLNQFENRSVVDSAVCSVSGSHGCGCILAGYHQSPFAVLWDTLTGDVIQSVKHGNGVTKVRVAPDGSAFATSSWDKRVRILG